MTTSCTDCNARVLPLLLAVALALMLVPEGNRSTSRH